MPMSEAEKRRPGRPIENLPRVKRPNALALWMRSVGVRPAEIARMLGVTQPLVYLWRSGRKAPGRRLAAEIERITGGVVRVASWN
jgi:predicted transcriptional regulator